MPCRDYESDSWGYNKISSEAKRLKEQNDRLARIACKVLTGLEEADKQELLVQILRDDEVREWWDKHKEADRRAQADIAERERQARIKQQALSKLTAEERKILGIKD